MKQLHIIGIVVSLAGLWSVLGPAGIISVSQAETAKYSKTVKTEYQYAVKVACSLLLPHQDGTLASGIYRTVVNIHNPTNNKIAFAAKVALATQFGSDPGPFDVTPFKEVVLQPDGAVGVNCFNIASCRQSLPSQVRENAWIIHRKEVRRTTRSSSKCVAASPVSHALMA